MNDPKSEGSAKYAFLTPAALKAIEQKLSPVNPADVFRRGGNPPVFGRKLPNIPMPKKFPYGKMFKWGVGLGLADAAIDIGEQIYRDLFRYTPAKPWVDWPGFSRTHGPYDHVGMDNIPDNLSPLAFSADITNQAISAPNYPFDYLYPQRWWQWFGLWDLHNPGAIPGTERYANRERWEVTDAPLATSTGEMAQAMGIGRFQFGYGSALPDEIGWLPREFPFEFPIGTPANPNSPTPNRFKEKPTREMQPEWRTRFRPGARTALRGVATTTVTTTAATSPATAPAGINVPNRPVTNGTPFDHKLEPPRKRVKERKMKATGAATLVRAFGSYSEIGDLIQAVNTALPKELQKRARPSKYMTSDELREYNQFNSSDFGRLLNIYRNADKLDLNKVVENVIKNQAEDALIGGASSKAKRALDRMVGARPQLDATDPLGVQSRAAKAKWWKEYNSNRAAQRQARKQRGN